MTRRVLAGWALALVSVSVLVAGAVLPAGAASSGPGIQLSTKVLGPGKTLVITGSGWTPKASVNATICGDDAISGTVDCAVTSTATMGATRRGLLWSHIAVVIPPAPCPCVVQVSGTNLTYTEKIPITIVGAPTKPVRTAKQAVTPMVRISDFKVVGSTTLASFFGGPAPRTLEFQLRNTWDEPVTPVLVGRWGKAKNVANVIEMPHMGPLGPGKSRDVHVPFSLTALSLGTYTVAVRVQLVGYQKEFGAAAATSQWPIGLFILGLLVLLVLVYIVVARHRRKKQGAETEQAPQGIVDEAGSSGPQTPVVSPSEGLTLP